MNAETLDHMLRWYGLDGASLEEDNDGQVIIYTGCKWVTHEYTDSRGEHQAYETLEPMDYEATD